MGVLILGLVLFLGVHSLRTISPDGRDRLAAGYGRGYRAAYSLVSLAGLVLIVWGYGLAREAPIPVWDPPVWTRHLALTLMLPVFTLLIASQLPSRIKMATRHPMLLAVKLWATAHLLANGTLADILLFGAFLAWAVLARISAKRHPRADVAPGAPKPVNDVIAVVGGLVLYVATLFYLHLHLIGVAPIG